MALKGKKKSRVRGSQGHRKPAAAPRPTYGGREKPRWYQTTAGLVIGFLVISTVIVAVWWFVADSRNEAQALEDEQAALQTATTDLRTVIQNVTPTVSEMATAADLEDDELPDKTKAWKNELAEVTTAVSQLGLPPEMAAVPGLLSQAMLLYVQSVEQYELLPDLEGKARDEVARHASASYQSGSVIFGSVIDLLDQARSEADLGPSELTVPGSQAVVPEPTPGGG